MPKKINQDAKAHENILSLYTYLLYNPAPISLKALAERFMVSKPTMLRYINSLNNTDYGKTIEEKRGRESFYYLDRPRNLPKTALSVEGLQQLAFCRDLIANLLPPSIRQNIEIALNHATAYLPSNPDKPLQGLPKVASSFTRGKIDYSPFQDILKTMLTAIRDKCVCTISYKYVREVEEIRSFDFAPKEVITLGEAIHIHGWQVTDKGAVRQTKDRHSNLLLQRIVNAELTIRKAEHLPEIEEHKEGYFGFMADEAFNVQVKFMNNAASYVAERIWSSEQEIAKYKDGSIKLSFTAQSEYEVISWILSFGANAKIISPKWLKTEMANKIQELSSLYDNVGKKV